MPEPHPGTFEVCPVCFWEDDNVQFTNTNFEVGANEESLIQAKQNFRKFKASSLKFIKKVRDPYLDETPEFK